MSDDFTPHDAVLPDDDDGFSDADLDVLYRAQPVARPPADFVDRVVPRARWRRLRWVAAGAALAAAAAVLAVWIGPGAPQTGALDARTTTTARLVDRAIAVADPGARVRWAMVDGTLEVQQPRGRVFYRVDDGPVIVRTPAGDVHVAGTCFSVEVEDMSPALKTFALGALAGVAATVVVYEGAVRVSNSHGEVELAPGQSARTASEHPPARLDPEREIRRVRALAPPAPPSPPRAPSAAPVVAEGLPEPTRETIAELHALVQETRAELKRVETELGAERAMRQESEGAPIAFPDGLAERFGEDSLRTRMQRAIDEAGLSGEMVSIDCSEYPCVVYAELENSQDGDHEKLFETDAMAPYADDGKNVSVWGTRLKDADGEEQQRNFVGLALMPKDEMDAETRQAIGKRLQFRNQQAFEAFRPEAHE